MQIQLEINEQKADFFLEYLRSLKDGIVEKMVITDDSNKEFTVNSVEEIQARVMDAEKNADYQEHEAFWKEMAVS